jgi:hypothetical protein
MTNKFLMLIAFVTLSGVCAFAEFEVDAGIYGGFGDAGAIGAEIQMGYLGRSESILWDVLFDGGIGYGYSKSSVDYNLGVLGEIVFGFVGIGIGGGFGNGTLYVRGEIPFLFGAIKLTAGYDYFVDYGGRFNFSILFRGAAALAFLNIKGNPRLYRGDYKWIERILNDQKRPYK